MQASLGIRRVSVSRILVAFGVALALVLGLQLGYALKASTVISGPAKAVVATTQPPAGDNSCVFIDGHKSC